MNDQTKLFFESHEKDFVKSLPCLGMSCDVCYLCTTKKFGGSWSSSSTSVNCVKTLKEDWLQYSRKKKLEKLLS